MDRRNFLAMGGVAAVAGTGAVAHGAARARTPAGGTVVPAGKLLMRRIPSSGEMIPADRARHLRPVRSRRR